MSPVPSPGYLDRFRSALISEIKAEMGRRDLTNSALALMIGESKQYVGSRLGAGNPHTGKRVEINVPDLYVIAGALDLDPRDLMQSAQDAAESSDPDVTIALAANEGEGEQEPGAPEGDAP